LETDEPPSLQYFKVMKARIDVCWESYEDVGLQYESDYFDWPFDIWPRNYDTIGNEISNLAFEHADITAEQKKQVLNTFFRVRELTFNINKNGEPYIAIVVDCG
jgi:hypothetical protein